MYYYEIQDVNGFVVNQSAEGYNTGIEAADAAKDALATMYPPNYPVEIRVSDGRFYQGQQQFSSTYYMDAEMVRQHALKRIEEANRQEFIDILANAQKESEVLHDQFSRGLLPPLDYAKYQESLWIRTRVDIESKG